MLLIKIARGGLALALVLGLSACTNIGAAPQSIVGQTFAEADGILPEDAVYLVQDASVLFGEKPSYDDSQFGSSRWTVIASCASAKTMESGSTIEIAVAPSEAVSEDDVRAARDGKYGEAVTCDF